MKLVAAFIAITFAVILFLVLINPGEAARKPPWEKGRPALRVEPELTLRGKVRDMTILAICQSRPKDCPAQPDPKPLAAPESVIPGDNGSPYYWASWWGQVLIDTSTGYTYVYDSDYGWCAPCRYHYWTGPAEPILPNSLSITNRYGWYWKLRVVY